MRGAGYARNKCLAEVNTNFVVFLDADDQISPMFIERCLSVWKSGYYVYVDWKQDNNIITASKEPWQAYNGEWHVLTTLLRAEDVRKVGGFDETLPGAEDTYMFWALTRAGICGIVLHEPLFTYGSEGKRARAFVESPAYAPTMQALLEKYGDKMCCGGDNPIKSFIPDQPNDIEAYAMWGGNRRELGIITGRLYPRGGNMNVMSVDPRDVDASPEKWQRVPPPAPPAKSVDVTDKVIYSDYDKAPPVFPANRILNGVGELVAARYGIKTAEVMDAKSLAATLPKPAATEMTAEAMREIVKPDVSKVRRLAKKGKQ